MPSPQANCVVASFLLVTLVYLGILYLVKCNNNPCQYGGLVSFGLACVLALGIVGVVYPICLKTFCSPHLGNNNTNNTEPLVDATV